MKKTNPGATLTTQMLVILIEPWIVLMSMNPGGESPMPKELGSNGQSFEAKTPSQDAQDQAPTARNQISPVHRPVARSPIVPWNVQEMRTQDARSPKLARLARGKHDFEPTRQGPNVRSPMTETKIHNRSFRRPTGKK